MTFFAAGLDFSISEIFVKGFPQPHEEHTDCLRHVHSKCNTRRKKEYTDLYRGPSLIRYSTPHLRLPYGPRHVLLQVPRGALLLMREVPLYCVGQAHELAHESPGTK